MKTDLFQSCGHCWVFQMCWHIECSSFTASFSRIWNSFSNYVQINFSVQFNSASQPCPHATPWTAAHKASRSITNSQSLPKLMSIESVMPSNHLIFCPPLFLLPSIFPNIRVFSNESALHIRWPKCWSFSFSISPSNEHPGLISFRMSGWILCSPRDS